MTTVVLSLSLTGYVANLDAHSNICVLGPSMTSLVPLYAKQTMDWYSALHEADSLYRLIIT